MNSADKQAKQDEVIDAIPVDEDATAFTGVVVSTHDGFCFLNQIRQGFASVATKQDVFCPAPFPVGALVEFKQLNPNPEKGDGHFRADEASLLAGSLAIAVGSKNHAIARTAAIFDLTRRDAVRQKRAKEISPEETLKAAANGPFAQFAAELFTSDERVDMTKWASEFLAEEFPSMLDCGFSISVTDTHDTDEEQNQLKGQRERYSASGLQGMADSLGREYSRFQSIRSAFAVMHKHDALRRDSVIPIQHLPELLCMYPVLYTEGDGAWDQFKERNPTPTPAHAFFCDIIPTQQWAWFFQIYNRRMRYHKHVDGREVMPRYLTEVRKEALRGADLVCIATPYLDVASAEWSQEKWQRNIDPALLGFIRDFPFALLYGKWSLTGLFPMACEMIADTMAHLRQSQGLLANIPKDALWIGGKAEEWPGSAVLRLETKALPDDTKPDKARNTLLPKFVAELLAAYDRGELFPYLRGETESELFPRVMTV